MERYTPVIWVKFKQEYFCEGGWTEFRAARPTGKSVGIEEIKPTRHGRA
jgi:hypothetical protein